MKLNERNAQSDERDDRTCHKILLRKHVLSIPS
jgi:hypothetical protein